MSAKGVGTLKVVKLGSFVVTSRMMGTNYVGMTSYFSKMEHHATVQKHQSIT